MNTSIDVLAFLYSRPRLSIALGVLILILGTIFVRVPQSISTFFWARTHGTIISSRVIERCCNSYTEGSYPEISYRYAVGDRQYMSTSIEALYVANQWGGAVHSTVERFPAGQEVTVFFNPQEPTQAVLEQGMRTSLPLALLVLAAGFVPIYVGALRAWKV